MLGAGALMARACTPLRKAGGVVSAVVRVRPSSAPVGGLVRLQGRLRPASSGLSSVASSLGAGPDSTDEGTGPEQRRAGAGGGGMSGQPLPPRTVSDEIVGFSCRTYMAGDSDDRYPNAHGIHPAEFKVELMVPVPLLDLSDKEKERLILLVGPRYRAKDQILRLVSDRFPNRIDNKRYLVHLLENLVAEARNVDKDE